MPCDDTSMKHHEHPASTMRLSRRFISSGSGVVWSAATSAESMRLTTVESSPARSPEALTASYSSVATVVLPLVPVTPTSFSCREGCPYQAEASVDSATDESGTLIQATDSSASGGICSHTTAVAPALRARSM